MTKEGQAQLAQLREEVELQILTYQYERNAVKQECWDSMETVGQTLYGFEEKLEVINFPLRKRSAADSAELERVKSARRLELAEERARRAQLGADAGDEAGGSDGSVPLYSILELYSSVRKRSQIVLLRDHIRRLKMQFNAEFGEALQAKHDDIKKMAVRNERMAKIAAELQTTVELYAPRTHALEQPSSLLEVQDGEITVPKVLNAQERAAKAEAERLEAERQAAAARDNPRERGVQDMMGGRLEDSAEEDVWIDLPRPGFLDSVHREEWTDDQKSQAEQYAAAVKDLEARREVRRKTLEAELATLREANAATRTAFDQRLTELFDRRIRAELTVYAEELKILLLLRTVQEDEDLGRLAKLLRVRTQLAERQLESLGLQQRAVQDMVEAAQAEYDTLLAADRKLDKEFKQRKEFADNPFIDVLYRLFRRRPKGSSAVPPRGSAAPAAAQLGVAAEDSVALDKAIDCPEGLEDHLWARLVELRNDKMASERAVRHQLGQLQERHAFHQQLVAATDGLRQQQAAMRQQLEWVDNERRRTFVDYPIVIDLKQGAVEVQHPHDFDPSFDATVLVPRDRIDQLNASIRNLGAAKVEFLTQRMELRKGIHMLEWEHRRLEM